MSAGFTRKPLTERQRYSILARDHYRCQFCGARGIEGVELQVDHLWPVSKGGTNDEWNLVAACKPCNMGKRAIAEPAFQARFELFSHHYSKGLRFQFEEEYVEHLIFLALYGPLEVWLDGRALHPTYALDYERKCNDASSALGTPDPEGEPW